MQTLNISLTKTLVPVLISSMLIVSLSGCEQQRANSESNVEPAETTHSQSHEPNVAIGEGNDHTIGTNQVDVNIQFPMFIPSINKVIHPLVPNLSETDYDESLISSVKSKRYDGVSYGLQAVSDFEFDGMVSNLVFEDLSNSTTTKLFPHNKFLIDNVFIPHSIKLMSREDYEKANIDSDDMNAENINLTDINLNNNFENANTLLSNDGINTNTNIHTNDNSQNLAGKIVKIPTTYSHIIYKVSQTPYSVDEKGQNIKKQHSLYMSNTQGSQLIKLHPDNEYVTASQWEPETLRYYFITQKDGDKNGRIDEKDPYYNYQIDFKKLNPVATQYNFDK